MTAPALSQEVIDALDGNGGRPSPMAGLASAVLLGTRLDELRSELDDVVDDVAALPLASVAFDAPTELTIASGAITITQSYHTVDTQSDAASDDLDSIAGGEVGQIIVLRPVNDARSVVIKHSASIICPAAEDITLAEDDDAAFLLCTGADVWVVLAFKTAASSGGGLGSKLASVATSKGASLVGVEDSAGHFAGATAEAVLAEIGAYIPRVLTDPGNAGAIPVTASGYVPLVTAGAETRTVADPTKVGLMLTLHFLTDGGDCVITFASPVNAAGNNTLTHDTAGEQVVLQSCKDGASAFAWRVVANEAATPLTTV